MTMSQFETSPLHPDDPVSACCQARIRRHEGEWSIWFTCSDCRRPVAEDSFQKQVERGEIRLTSRGQLKT